MALIFFCISVAVTVVPVDMLRKYLTIQRCTRTAKLSIDFEFTFPPCPLPPFQQQPHPLRSESLFTICWIFKLLIIIISHRLMVIVYYYSVAQCLLLILNPRSNRSDARASNYQSANYTQLRHHSARAGMNKQPLKNNFGVSFVSTFPIHSLTLSL